jgi:hypothetical protein
MAVHIAYPDELLDDNKLEGFYDKVCDILYKTSAYVGGI